MADVTFEMEGGAALNAKLKAVTYDVKRKGGRFGLRKAANLVREAAQRKAEPLDDPRTGQKIADNIAVRWDGRYFSDTGDLKFRVYVKGGNRTTGSPADTGAGGATPHWHLIELGTSNMPAQPFMRPALSENIAAASSEFARQFEKSVDRAVKRAAKNRGG